MSFFGLILFGIHIICVHSWPWQLKSILPTDLVGAQIGIWNNTLHLINGVYNATRLDVVDNNLVLWLTTNLSTSISITGSESATFSTNPKTSWDISTTSNSLGGIFCYSKCSAQINEFLFILSPETIDTNEPTGRLIVYDLETQQLIPPPTGLQETPYYLNGGACVVHNDTHLFSFGGYNTQCPSDKFDARCNDPINIIIYDTISYLWTQGALLPDAAKVDSAACSMDKAMHRVYLFGGYNKNEDALSNKVLKYFVDTDQFDDSFAHTMRYHRSEFNALLDNKKNYVYLIGGAITVATNTAQLIEVYDINIERFIDVTIDGLSKSIRWYGSSIYSYNDTIDVLLVVGGHTGAYQSTDTIEQNMTDYVQYLVVNNNTDPYTDFPTVEPTLQPTLLPTLPSKHPTTIPTLYPTFEPTIDPTHDPTKQPTIHPTVYPTDLPSWQPTVNPTQTPSVHPSTDPTIFPTIYPSINPTLLPTIQPSIHPTNEPSTDPTLFPTMQPTAIPTLLPTIQPSFGPTDDPTTDPTFIPTVAPTTDPTWAPFTAPPSSTEHGDPYIMDIYIEVDCASESLSMPSIYPPTVNDIVYNLLTPKFEKDVNIWVNTKVIQTEEDECHIHIDSMYTTHILSNAQQIYDYANTTLSNDLIHAFEQTFGVTLDPDDIEIIFQLIIIPTTDPTSEPTVSPITTESPQITATDHIIVDGTSAESSEMQQDTPINAFEEWLFAENNLNWIIILVVCCAVFPCCAAVIWFCNHYQTQKLLRRHKKEIQKFTTLSSTLPPSPHRQTHRRNTTHNDSESSDDDGDGYTHMSPAHAFRKYHGTKYEHVARESTDGYVMGKPPWTIPMKTTNTAHRMNVMHDLHGMYGYNYAAHSYPQENANSDVMDGKIDEPDGSTTDLNIVNRSRQNTATGTSNKTNTINGNTLYNDSDRIEYKDNDDMDEDIEPQITNSQQTKSTTNPNNYYTYSQNKSEDDYLVVTGMGLTPTLMALSSGSSKDNLTVSIQKRNVSKANTNSNVNQCDDYKISANVNEASSEHKDGSDDSTVDEYQDANPNVFSPPISSMIKRREKGKMHTYRQAIHLVELEPISPSPQHEQQDDIAPPMAMSDAPTLPPEPTQSDVYNSSIFQETEHDEEYEDMYTTPRDGPQNTSIVNHRNISQMSGTSATNTINSEEQHHENTFILK